MSVSPGLVEPVSLAVYLRTLADVLDAACRVGSADDVPEGDRFIILSDTFARELAAELRQRAAAL